MPEKFYLTTPIYYVNARPHIGHAYTTIVADVLARRSRAQGIDTWFLTGTDEHGQKIERSALAAGIPPQQFADGVSAEFRQLWDRMGLTYDQYIRTTDEAHKRGVQKLFRELQQRGHIYLSSYTGQYCVSEETFVEGPPGTIGPDGRPTETVTEENYFFRLSAFQQPLLDLIESGGLVIEPEARRNEVLSFLRGGLKDLSISRSSFTWGIPVPGDPSTAQDHVIYVWLDALANYMTAVGYGSDDPGDVAKFEKYWPADLHMVGKEIIRFHCVYWPAFLLAADLPRPKKVVAHGWLLFEESKMSKSRGNIVRTETILEAFGTLCPPAPPRADSSELPSSELENQASSPENQARLSDSLASLKGTASAVPSPVAEGSAALAADGNAEPQRLKPHDRRSEDGTVEAVSLSKTHSASKRDQDLFASDVLRYFLLREIPFGQDGSFSFDALITRYNADLANGYGNLVSRVLKMIHTYDMGEVVSEHSREWTEKDWLSYAYKKSPTFSSMSSLKEDAAKGVEYSMFHTIENSINAREVVSGKYGGVGFQAQLAVIMLAVRMTDGFLSSEAPWKLAKDAESTPWRQEVLYTAAESIRIITALLYPILPFATASVWRQLGLGDIEDAAARGDLRNLQWGGLQPGTKLGPLSPIFPRADKGLAQIMTSMENQKNQSPQPEPSKFVDETFNDSATPAKSFDPAAGPRTAAFTEAAPGLQVAGSNADTTERPGTPSHTEAHPSGIFSGQPADASPQITIDDFAKVELRVAQVLVCERIPKADKLLRLEVDLGYEKRQILSGIAEWYTPEDLIGRRIVVITNLAPRKMRGLESHGMLLAASAPAIEGEKPGKPALATFLDSDTLPLGSRLK